MKKGFARFIEKSLPRELTESETVGKLKSNPDFYFCGSSRFKELYEQEKDFLPDLDFSNTDDWDFSYDINNFGAVEDLLVRMGFVRQEYQEDPDGHSPYLDDTFAYIWKHPEFKIDVVARYEFKKYKAIWSSVSVEFYYHYLWKSAPHRDQDSKSVAQHKRGIADWLNLSLVILNRGMVEGRGLMTAPSDPVMSAFQSESMPVAEGW